MDPKTVEADFHLQQDKKMLNSSYVCMVMNPLRSEFICDENMEFHINKDYKTLKDMQAGLDSFYSKWNNFLNYAAGCMITSYARYELYEFIKVIGYENCLYSDTDSLYYVSTPEIENKIEKLNEEKHKAARFVELDNGKKEKAIVYVMADNRKGICPPASSYFNCIFKGCMDNGIDTDYLFDALDYSYNNETEYNQYKTREMI